MKNKIIIIWFLATKKIIIIIIILKTTSYLVIIVVYPIGNGDFKRHINFKKIKERQTNSSYRYSLTSICFC
jgi:hypothetical protein